MVVVTVALLLAAVGSKNPDGTVAEAVLLTVPVAVERTGAVTVKVATAPLLRLTVVPMLPVPLAAPQLPVPVVIEQVQLVPATLSLLLSKVSVTVAPVTLLGPLLVTVMV